jgi:repressor LexA
MTIGQRIKNRRKELHLTADDLAEKLGKDRSTIYRYENGDIGNFPTDILEPLAKILKTTPAYLMGWDSSPLPKNVLPMPSFHQLPVVGSIACGTPILAEENIEDYEPCPDFVHADFCLHCKGDSMINARINDGDTVFIRAQPEVENGEIAAIEFLDGSSCKATLKRFHREGNKVMLSPENAKYSPMIFVGEEINKIKVVGKAVYFLSEIK